MSAVAIDPARFRQILGHYPTGVAVVTALGPDAEPVGMVVGSFSSVSLDPPLVAFMPDKKSSTYARLESASSFVVNVLSADQMALCRTLASKTSTDKWAGLSWRASESGAPILEGAVAWVECERYAVHDAGDHYIVLGQVRRLDVGDAVLPLLFFQGGYGRFSPMSLVAPSERDLIGQLSIADVARREMEKVAAELQVECIAQAAVGDDLMHIATAGTPRGLAAPTRVGIRMPAIPPFGGMHVAWADEKLQDEWLGRCAGNRQELYRDQLRRVRDRGWSLGLLGSSHPVVEDRIKEFSAGEYTPEFEKRLRRLMEGLGDHYEPEDLTRDCTYDVRFVGAPVFSPDGQVEVVLKLFSLPREADLATVNRWISRIREAADAVTRTIGGCRPGETQQIKESR